MRATIIAIGNSKGVRIPKALLEESGIDKEVELKLTKNGIKIVPVKYSPDTTEAMMVSETAFRESWISLKKDKAWQDL